MSNKTISNRFSAGEYQVQNHMWNKVKDLYRFYVSSIKITSEKEGDLLDKLGLEKLVYKLTSHYLDPLSGEGHILLRDGMFKPLSIKKNEYFKTSKVFTIKDVIKNDTYKREDLYYSIDFFTNFNFINNYHKSRLIKVDYKGSNTDYCNYIKNACELYERALNSAGFILEHNNHTIVKLASGEDRTADFNYKSSILSMSNSSEETKYINDLREVLDGTLITDQFKISILGTQDEVVRLNSTYSNDSYKVIRDNLVAKTSIPYSILFGSIASEDESPAYIMFFETINNFFKREIEPYIKLVLKYLGFDLKDFTFNYLYYEDVNFKNKRLETLNKTLDVLNKLNKDEQERINKIKDKLLTSIENML